MSEVSKPIVIIGGGFSGLSAAYELANRDLPVTVLERDAQLGGLAGTFDVPGGRVEKFYHHWFTSDRAIFDLIEELGLEDRLLRRPSRTGLYYANSIYRLASPTDLLKFRALSFLDRIRLGLLALRVRRVRDWRALESKTARDWLIELAGKNVYRVVWEPLLKGKFGAEAEHVSAVWIWNKLKLRGSSRGKGGREELVYMRGGFATLIDELDRLLREKNVTIRTSCPVGRIATEQGRVVGVETADGFIDTDTVIVTSPIPPFLEMCPDLPEDYRSRIGRIKYLGNICIVLNLRRSLSEIYWLNVNDPSFPFVGIIEHTNFEPPSSYAGSHLVYLSKYLATDDPLYRMTDDEAVAYCLPHVRRMFPEFHEDWIAERFAWRTPYAQPVVARHYSRLRPAFETPVRGLWLCTMAQIYPEDRGTNYAVQYGREVGRQVALVGVDDRAAGQCVETSARNLVPSG